MKSAAGQYIPAQVAEQYVWKTPSGDPIGAKWLIYLGTWACLYTTVYELLAWRAAVAALDRDADANALARAEDLARAAYLMRALVNPLGLVGLCSWFAFVRGKDEGPMKNRPVWLVVSFVKHAGPELAFLVDVTIRPRPLLRLRDAGLALLLPATSFRRVFL